jgi:DNA polymerase III alpha subunit
VTLEDETGITNVIVWPGLLEQQRKEILNARLLTCMACGSARGR